MVSLYSTWWVKPEKEKELHPALQELAENIEKHEEGTLMYLVHAPRYDFPKDQPGKNPIKSKPMVRPGTIVFVEKYASWDAFKIHLHGPYFTNFVKSNKSKFVLGEDGNPFVQVVFMDEITGFIRDKQEVKKD